MSVLDHLAPNSSANSSANATDSTLFLITEPVDMRLGTDGLSALVQTRLATSPCAGAAYLFMNARRNRLKLLLWDGTGVWLAVRRLHKGRFVFGAKAANCGEANAAIGAPTGPPTGAPTGAPIEITQEQWRWLIAGVDWQRLSASAKNNAHWRVG